MNVGSENGWTAFGDSETLARELDRALAQDDLAIGRGVAFIAGPNSGARRRRGVSRGVGKGAGEGVEHFVLIQLGAGGSIDSLAPAMRTFCLEEPRKRCTIVYLQEWDYSAARTIKTEASLCHQFHEVIVAADGTRQRPVFKPVFIETRRETRRIDSADVFLVPGGGKGITFESAKRIAEYSGSRLALFGRSTPARDEHLARNLRALADAGIQFHYVSADRHGRGGGKQGCFRDRASAWHGHRRALRRRFEPSGADARADRRQVVEDPLDKNRRARKHPRGAVRPSAEGADHLRQYHRPERDASVSAITRSRTKSSRA